MSSVEGRNTPGSVDCYPITHAVDLLLRQMTCFTRGCLGLSDAVEVRTSAAAVGQTTAAAAADQQVLDAEVSRNSLSLTAVDSTRDNNQICVVCINMGDRGLL